MPVVELQVAADSVLAFAGAAVSAAAQLFFGQDSEPALDQVEPGSAGRREVQVEARMAQQPALDRRGFVGGVVIDESDGARVRVARYRRWSAETCGTRWPDAADATSRLRCRL
jgi:hypothetical protein